MDFGTLLSVAQKNENNKQPIACYQTKFTPPKRPNKQAKALSQNIKKFLARKEEEEKQKVLEEKKKRENLLALRDHKAQSRINKHLKVCKAANKSVLADAIDNENTAVTMAGPSQPDEDDYGYVSQEASAFYNQLMTKYNNTPSQHTSGNGSQKKTVKDIASTKDRVKQALKQQEAEESSSHRRKRKHFLKELETEVEERAEKDTKDVKKETEDKFKPKKRQLPPPMDFTELLKIAEKKQHEPIIIDIKPKNDEPERLLTKKQMKEYAKEKEWRERKEQRSKANNMNSKEGSGTAASKPNKIQDNRPNTNNINKIPKISEKVATTPPISNKAPSKTAGLQSPATKKSPEKNSNKTHVNNKCSISKPSERDILLEERRKLENERKKLEEMKQAIEEEKKKLKLGKNKTEEVRNTKSEKIVPKGKLQEKQESLKRAQTELPTSSISRARIPPMPNGKPKQFPPTDIKPFKSRNMAASKEQRRPFVNQKRRIRDDDEDEYDSELDDFIDDDVEDGTEDYSKYISEIFGYDKSRYRQVENEHDDDVAMESSFAQQLKEEYVSTKIGIMEDLEDMRMEAMEKKRKALLKRKIKK